jgi:hypothetical protein
MMKNMLYRPHLVWDTGRKKKKIVITIIGDQSALKLPIVIFVFYKRP